MPDLDRFRPFLWAATALCLLAAVVSIPVVADDASTDEPASRTDLVADGDAEPPAAGGDSGGWVGSAGGSTTDAPPAAASGAPADGASPSKSPGPAPSAAAGAGAGEAAPPTTTASASAPTTAPPAVDDLGAPQDPGPSRPPRAGTYRYKLTGTDGQTSEGTTQIEDKGTQGGETRQVVKQRGQGGANVDNDVAWRGDGLYVLSSVIAFGSSTMTCDWNPDTLQLKLPITAGTTWESTSSCTVQYGATPITIVRKLTGKVTELRRVKVAGQAVDVWAIETTDRIEAAGNAQDSSGTTLFSPKHGLIVRSDSKVSTPEGPKQITLELQNLDPE